MNKPFIYGILCEDKAHSNFIKYYLNQHFREFFQESEQFGWKIRATNAREVDDSISDATRLGFTKFNLNVLFVGRDADTTKETQIENLKNTLIELCHNHRQVILMIPVQSIEHWLLYLQWRQRNPASTKNESLEHIMRHEAKTKIYGGKLRVEKQLEIASQLLANFDVAWLETRSASFRHFHQQVTKYVADTTPTLS